jgi:hypothetical protein
MEMDEHSSLFALKSVTKKHSALTLRTNVTNKFTAVIYFTG